MDTGTVKWFNNPKGWGFILTGDGKEAFVHYSDITGEGFKSLAAGDSVEFRLLDGPNGAKAVNVQRV